MSSPTTTAQETLARILANANPNQISDALKLVNLAQMLEPVKITLASITADATVDITAFSKGDTELTIDAGLSLLADAAALPAILMVKSCRVTTSGTANSVGSYMISDAGGTAVSPTASSVAGIALLSDDGTTLTFPTTVTGLVLEYIPRSATDFDEIFAPSPR